MADIPLVDELRSFFQSSATNVEVMPDELREAVSVKTQLDIVVSAAVTQKSNIVIAGTAGSGKTHLLQLIQNLEKYEVVSDLAALPESKWQSLFAKGRPTIVAGNEGAFLQGAHKGIPIFKEIVRKLHSIQRGEDQDYGDNLVVIDAAGFDPAGQHIVAEMLKHPLVAELVGSTAPELRGTAWQMFGDERVAERVAQLVEAASAESDADGFTFRQLWQFVADLAIQGEGTEALWFYRVMLGNSEVSRRIRTVFSARSLALPHLGNRLWHGDILHLRDALIPEAFDVLVRILPPNFVERSESERRELFDILRLLLAFGLKESPLDERLLKGAKLWDRVRQGEVAPLTEAINEYMTYSLVSLADDLELWIQHDTERRLNKPDTQISIGVVPAAMFEIRRNRVVANLPKGTQQIYGGRFTFRQRNGDATLTVTKDLIDGILQSRSHRTAERRHIEFDWRLMRFFGDVAKSESKIDRLRVLTCDFQGRSGQLVTWKLGDGHIHKVTSA
jgi:hypothetical protein